ncbi:serine hydrolase domain-containing protein [Abyssisolibacter fermentans]|uniref:serine hydrolase domain-containing protein n=1 Tax=Abyssisolibacter fermentans TaxID=1766203 RepID=UPI0008372530|nr:serine hydrolase domain-containing protein [Abyssisolibacter fermentans]
MKAFRIMSVLIILGLCFSTALAVDYTNEDFDQYIKDKMKQYDIPGAAVVVIKGNETVLKKGYGFADIENKIEVTEQTLFELGSNSKAFTAVGILKLKDEGLLNVNDSVAKYLPYLKMKYNGEIVDLKIKHFLNQTSGVPFKTINNIPISNEKNALEETVKTLIGVDLISKPGEKFRYATINYDVLGLIIEKVTGKSFEEYMKKEILDELGLNETVLFRDENNIAKGYKYFFFRPHKYEAPIYRGNKPAGYFISNANDMEKWLKIQLGGDDSKLGQIIYDNNIDNLKVINGEFNYSCGWYYHKDKSGTEVCHGGINPNYTSYVVLRPDDEVAVAVLTNVNSTGVINICQNLATMCIGASPQYEMDDSNKKMDKISSIAIIILSCMILFHLHLFSKLFIGIFKHERSFTKMKLSKMLILSVFGIFIILVSFIFWFLPQIIRDASWQVTSVFMPNSFKVSIIFLASYMWLLYIYIILKQAFRKVGYNESTHYKA